MSPGTEVRRELTVVERIAVLETEVEVLERNVGEIRYKVDDIHSLMMQAKGARWIILGTITVMTSIFGVLYYVASLLHLRSSP